VSAPDEETILRRLARDQWVRFHGTPRVTVLAGEGTARRYWAEWARLAGGDAALLDGDAGFGAVFTEAVTRASSDPKRAIAVIVHPDAVRRWQAGAPDRLRALAAEGLLEIPEKAGNDAVPMNIDARSAAEAALFEALEATPATAGRFELNGRLAVRFGNAAAEVDLLSRRDAIAIEIDGYHHFTDADRYRRDREKDFLLQTQGLFVIRLLAEDVMREPRAAVTSVCRALAHRRDG
jgi:very-short-patch-repair endonuclease